MLAKPLGVWPPYLEELTEDMIKFEATVEAVCIRVEVVGCMV